MTVPKGSPTTRPDFTYKVPTGGPPKTDPLCKFLGKGLFQFRRQPKGKKLRVVWFYGGGAVIVCAVAFAKAERTPRTKIAQALLLRDRYRLAKAEDEIEIVDIKETEWKITWTSSEGAPTQARVTRSTTSIQKLMARRGRDQATIPALFAFTKWLAPHFGFAPRVLRIPHSELAGWVTDFGDREGRGCGAASLEASRRRSAACSTLG